MRTVLRLLGAVVCGTAAVLGITAVGVAVFCSLDPRPEPGLRRFAALLGATGPFVGLAVVAVGGVLWFLADRLPAPPGQRSWTLAAPLRVLAGVQLGVGGIVLAATVGATVAFVLDRPPPPAWTVIFAWVGMFFAFLTTGLGGLLWCAVRVAYLERPPAAP